MGLTVFGCGGGEDPVDVGPVIPDLGPEPDDGPVDLGPMTDAGLCPYERAGSVPGAACRRGTECEDGSTCNAEINATFTPGDVELPVTQYPGSLCGDQCDPDAAVDTCGDCATCAGYTRVGRLEFDNLTSDDDGLFFIDGVCRQNCEANFVDNGGCRTGYACDVEGNFCVESCRDDAQCNLRGDLTVDPDGVWTCSTDTFRCTHPGTDGVVAGDACETDGDCMADGECTGGLCIRRGCANPSPDFACAGDETCTVFGVGANGSACARPCTIGAEAVADRLGVGGSGDTCDAGQSCVWDGESNMGDPAGACLPGSYNDITESNVGAPCSQDEDCYSPYGYGRCLTTQNFTTGFCAVANCVQFDDGGEEVDGIIPAVASVGTQVCDPADQICANFGDFTFFCLQECTDAAVDCGRGQACNEDILAPRDGEQRPVCWDTCGGAEGDDGSDDCADGFTCREESGATCGEDIDDCVCRASCSTGGDCVEGEECVTGGGDDAMACDGEDDCYCRIVPEEDEA